MKQGKERKSIKTGAETGMKTGKRTGLKTRALSLLLVVLLVFAAGCGGNGIASGTGDGSGATAGEGTPGGGFEGTDGEDGIAMGRYGETETDLSEQLGQCAQLLRLADGSIVILDEDNGALISRDNGVSFEAWPMEWFEEMETAEEYIMDMNMASDGTIGVVYDPNIIEESQKDDFSYEISTRCRIIKPDGTQIDTEIPVTEEDLYINRIWVSDSGRYFAGTFGPHLYEIKEDGTAEVFLTLTENPELVAFAGNLMILDGYDYESLLLYDMETGTYLEDPVLAEFVQQYYGDRSFNGSSWYDLYVFAGEKASEEENILYLAGDKGLHRHVIGGGAVEQLVDGNLSRLSSPAYGLKGMLALADAEFLALTNSGKLIRFTYDPEMPTVPAESLRIYSLTENSNIRQAITAYQVQHGEVYVDYEVGMEEGGSVTREDALKKLNTEIVAGNGPDLLVMDGLPMDSYIEKGLLLRLDDFIAELTASDSYFENFIQALSTKEGSYVLPGEVFLPLIMGKEKYTSKMQDLTGIAETVEQLRAEYPGEDLLAEDAPRSILKRMAIVSAPAFLTESGELDREAIGEYLTETKRIYDAQSDGLARERVEYYSMIADLMLAEYGEKWQDNTFYYSIEDLQYLGDNAKLAMGLLTYPYNYAELWSITRVAGFEEDEIVPMNGLCRNVFVPDTMLGISAASGNVSRAKDFLTMFFGADFQTSLGSFPINETAFNRILSADEKKVGEDGAYGSVGMSDGSGMEVSLDIYWVNEEQQNLLREYMKAADTPYLEDPMLEDVILTEGTSYFSGEQTLEEALSAIEQQMAIYMAE